MLSNQEIVDLHKLAKGTDLEKEQAYFIVSQYDFDEVTRIKQIWQKLEYNTNYGVITH